MSIKNAKKQERSKKVKDHFLDRLEGFSHFKKIKISKQAKKRIVYKVGEAVRKSNASTDKLLLKDFFTKKEMGKYGIPQNAFALIEGGKAYNIFFIPH